MIKFSKILLLILLMVLPACSGAITTPTLTGAPPPTAGAQPSTGYPAEDPGVENQPTQAYPGPPVPSDDPLAGYPKSLEVPQPKAGLGVITGRILEVANNEVYLAPTLILGEMTYPSDPNAAPPLVGFSETTDPRGIQDQSGKFVFQDIKPGTYAVVVWTPASSTLVTDKEGNTAVVEVTADKVVDMGDVYTP